MLDHFLSFDLIEINVTTQAPICLGSGPRRGTVEAISWLNSLPTREWPWPIEEAQDVCRCCAVHIEGDGGRR